jgi:hypothetical protein
LKELELNSNRRGAEIAEENKSIDTKDTKDTKVFRHELERAASALPWF